MVHPIKPQEIDNLPGVEFSFQADRDFQKIHETTPEAGAICDVASVALKFVGNFASQVDLGSLDRMVASSPSRRFMLFSFNAKSADPPGPRVFGITTGPSIQVETLSDQINQII